MKKGLRRILISVLVAAVAVGWYIAYRAVNRWYEPLLPYGETVTYEMGQWVPIGPEPANIIQSEEFGGYNYQVNSWQIVDTDAYLQENQLDDPWVEPGTKPEKLLLVTVTIENDNSKVTDFNLYRMEAKTKQVKLDISDALCASINECLEYPMDISVPVSAKVTVTLPYMLFRHRFSGTHWRNIEDRPFYIKCPVVNPNWENRIVPLT